MSGKKLEDKKEKKVKPTIEVRQIQTSGGSVEKISLPYIHWQINPSHLKFDKSGSSPILDQHYKIMFLDGKKYLTYTGSVLGQGSYGTVCLAQDKDTRKWIAIKIPKVKASFEEEIQLLNKSGNFVFFDKETKIIGMKLLMGQELFKAIVHQPENRKLSPQHFSFLQKLAIAKNILKKIAGLHHDVKFMKGKKDQKEVIFHRDIKSDNICLNPETLMVAYCDYGFAVALKGTPSSPAESIDMQITDPKPTQEKILGKRIGTPVFMAPEIFYSNDGQIEYNEATEVYALGITLAEIFDVAIYDQKSNRYIISNENNIPDNLFQLISSMVDHDPAKRPTVLVAAKTLNAIFRDAGKSNSLNVCIISIDEFCKFKPREKELFILNIIQSEMNAVVLQGSETTSHSDYYQVRYELIEQGIISIAPFMIKGESQDAIYRVAKDHYDHSLASLNTKVFLYNSENRQFEEKTNNAQQVSIVIPVVESNQNNSTAIKVANNPPAQNPDLSNVNLLQSKDDDTAAAEKTFLPKPGFFKRHPILTGVLIGLGVTVLGAAAVTAVVFSGGIAIAGIVGAAAAAGSFITGGVAAGTTATIVGASAIGSGLVIAGGALGAAGGAIAQNISSKKPDNSPQEEKKVSIDEKNKPESKKEIQAKQEESLVRGTIYPNPSKQEASLTQHSMFSKSITKQEINDINSVTKFLANHIEFFCAALRSQQEFTQWISLNPKSAVENLFADLMAVLKATEKEDISVFLQFKDTILGNEERKGLVDKNVSHINDLLAKNGALRQALKKHIDNYSVIDAINLWYQDNNVTRQQKGFVGGPR